ncbi:hypothetical protein [Catelliglobosispora koreensis]|uniref:hypothetical protein n=1 Tax=Catelliglobosispora koreensis TaxID=129052 RepID=UPI0003813276|nr:hypothetical protein [Catelliglobosispora koreensis]
MDSARKVLTAVIIAGAMIIGVAAPAAAAAGTLTVTAPTAPIAFNATFSMNINYANNGATTIVDPDIALYIMAKNGAGVAQPLAPANVTITAPSIPVYKWDTGAGTQVGVKFFPDSHANLAPGWNINYVFSVGVQMPPGTASLGLSARVWKSSNSATVYATWAGQVTVTPSPAPTTASPTPRPRPSTPAPPTASPTPSAETSVTPSEPAPSEPVITAEPTFTEPIVTLPATSSSLSMWVWLAAFLIAVAMAMLVWVIFRWRQDDDGEPAEG